MTNALLISTLYKGPHYGSLSPYKSDIISNHKKFAEYNNMDYRLYNGGELEYRFDAISPYTFTKYDIPVNPMSTFPGVGKLYAILAAKEDYYPEVSYFVFVDFDSIFLNKALLSDKSNYVKETASYVNHIASFSGKQFPYQYDTSFFYYYCMYNGISYDDLEKYAGDCRYNSGLFIVNSKFITKESVDSYVEFCKSVHEDKVHNVKQRLKPGSLMRIPYTTGTNSDIKEHSIFHPSDEVYFQYQRLVTNKQHDGTHYPILNENWNFIGDIENNWKALSHLNHIHCINKSQIPIALDRSNV